MSASALLDAGKLNLFAGRRDAGKRALVDATDSPARSYFVTFGSLISSRKRRNAQKWIEGTVQLSSERPRSCNSRWDGQSITRCG